MTPVTSSGDSVHLYCPGPGCVIDLVPVEGPHGTFIGLTFAAEKQSSYYLGETGWGKGRG